MTLIETLELIRAGYTKEEINAMMTDPEKPADPAAKPADPVAKPAADPETPADPTAKPADPAGADPNALIMQLTSQVMSLTKTIQNSNLLSANQPAPTNQSAEQVLASLINPTFKGENK